MRLVWKMNPSGIQVRNRCKVFSVTRNKLGFWLCSRTNWQSWKIWENSPFNDSFILLTLSVTIWSLEKSKTSSLSSFRICILFSQRISDVLDDPTRSLMNDGQFCGHSCLRISTSVRFSFPIKTLSCFIIASSDDILITFATTKFFIPSFWSFGIIFHLRSIIENKYQKVSYFIDKIVNAICKRPMKEK